MPVASSVGPGLTQDPPLLAPTCAEPPVTAPHERLRGGGGSWDLYPKLEQCGLRIPGIHPVRIGDANYDNTWQPFHVTSLKVLRSKVEEGSFDIQR